MANIKELIDAQIKANGVRAITGPILNLVLKSMVDACRPFPVVTGVDGIITNADFKNNLIAKIEFEGITLLEGIGFTKPLNDTTVLYEDGYGMPEGVTVLITYRS